MYIGSAEKVYTNESRWALRVRWLGKQEVYILHRKGL